MRICANHFYFARIGSLVLGKSHFAARGRRFQVNIPTAFISTFRPQNGPSAFGCVQNELRFANWSSCVASKRKTNSRSSKTCKRYPVRGGRRGRGRVGGADSTPACKFRKGREHWLQSRSKNGEHDGQYGDTVIRTRRSSHRSHFANRKAVGSQGVPGSA